MRAQYWNMMTQKKYHLFYLSYHLNLYVKIERWLNIFLAIVSTGSLVGLFACEEYQKVLAAILALAQIVTAARPYFPFAKRIKDLDKGITLLTKVYSSIEKEWNDINIEDIDDSKINDILYKFAKEWDDVDAEILKKDSLPFIKKFYEKAAEENERYFKNMFGGEN